MVEAALKLGLTGLAFGAVWLFGRCRLRLPQTSPGAALLSVGVLCLLFGVTVGVMGALRYGALNARLYDLGIMENVVWRASHGDFSSFLVGHFRPALLAFAPLYRLTGGSAYALLWGQAAALAGGGFLLYFVLKRAAGSTAALLFTLVYLLYPATWHLALFDVHSDAFFPLFAAITILGLERRSAPLLIAGALLCLLTKEPLALAVSAFGVTAFFCGMKRSGAAVALMGLVWFAAATLWLIPHFTPLGKYPYASDFPGGEGGLFGVARELVTNPLVVTSLPDLPGRLMFLAAMAGPSSLLFILSPLSALGALPHLLISFLSENPNHHGAGYQYGASIVIFLVYAAGKGLARFPAERARRLAFGAVIVALVYNVLDSSSPVGVRFWLHDVGRHTKWVYRAKPEDLARRRFIASVLPEGVSLVCQNDLMTVPVPHRDSLGIYPEGVGLYSYVLLDTTRQKWVGDDIVAVLYWQEYGRVRELYDLVAEQGGVQLFRLKPSVTIGR